MFRVRAQTRVRLSAHTLMCVGTRLGVDGWTDRKKLFNLNSLRRPPPVDGGWTEVDGEDGGGDMTGCADACASTQTGRDQPA